MSKLLPASCVSGTVTIDALPAQTPPLPALPVPASPALVIPLATIVGQGVGASTGFVLIDGENVYYIPNISGDLKTLLERTIDTLTQVKTGLDKVASALTTLDTTGFLIAADAGVPSPPVAASDISAITAAATQIDSIKAQMNTLNGALK